MLQIVSRWEQRFDSEFFERAAQPGRSRWWVEGRGPGGRLKQLHCLQSSAVQFMLPHRKCAFAECFEGEQMSASVSVLSSSTHQPPLTVARFPHRRHVRTRTRTAHDRRHSRNTSQPPWKLTILPRNQHIPIPTPPHSSNSKTTPTSLTRIAAMPPRRGQRSAFVDDSALLGGPADNSEYQNLQHRRHREVVTAWRRQRRVVWLAL